jgi:hypothetical protein
MHNQGQHKSAAGSCRRACSAAATQPGQKLTNSTQYNHRGPAEQWDLREGAGSCCWRQRAISAGQPEVSACICCCSDTTWMSLGRRSLERKAGRANPHVVLTPTARPPHTPRPCRRCAGGPAPAMIGAVGSHGHSHDYLSLLIRCHPAVATKDSCELSSSCRQAPRST